MHFKQLEKQDCRVTRHRAEQRHLEAMLTCNSIHKNRCNPAKEILGEED